MAEQNVATVSNAPLSPEEQLAEFSAHKRTYDAFLVFTKWSIISVVVLLIILYFALVH